MKPTTLLSILLEELNVPFTHHYSDKAYRTMPFPSLFGFTKLLESYGIEAAGYAVPDTSAMAQVPTPYVAGLSDGTYCVVSSIAHGKATLRHADRPDTVTTIDELARQATGNIVVAYPGPQSIEPSYRRHRISDAGRAVKPWLLAAVLAFIFTWLVVTDGITHSLWSVLLTLLDLGGLYISYLLILKQLHIHSGAAEHVCGIIEQHGCSKVLATEGSSFMGLFHWAEVGLAYFSVTLVAQIAFPSAWPMLAAISLCCLPFSLWSVWYQRTRAHAWCTLCLTVQSIFWLQFVCYLCWGMYSHIWPLHPCIILLGAIYLAALLLINRLTTYFGPAE